MTKLRQFIWISAAVVISLLMMHILFIRKYNMRDAAIHIVQSLQIDLNKNSQDQNTAVDPHGNTVKQSTNFEEVAPEVVNLKTAPPEELKKGSEKIEEPEKPPITVMPVEEVKKIVTKEAPKKEPEKSDVKKKDATETAEDKMCKAAEVGPLAVDQRIPEMEDIIKEYSVKHGGWVQSGGKWRPKDCKPSAKVAIIIPFRNRERQLKLFLKHMHPILHRQNLMYQIFVVEQSGDDPFNRAGLFNIGYKEAIKTDDFNCLIFTDVDLLPEDDRNSYGCPTSPRHMSVAIDKFNYRLPYEGIFGGVGAFKREDFEKVNGFSNLFWGWGGEDDDLYARIRAKGFKLTRPSMTIGRYTMVKLFHFQSHGADPNRMNLLQNSAARMGTDGLNSLEYKLRKRLELPLVTIVNVILSKSMYQ